MESVRAVRRRLGWSQSELAQVLGKSQSFVSRLEDRGGNLDDRLTERLRLALNARGIPFMLEQEATAAAEFLERCTKHVVQAHSCCVALRDSAATALRDVATLTKQLVEQSAPPSFHATRRESMLDNPEARLRDELAIARQERDRAYKHVDELTAQLRRLQALAAAAYRGGRDGLANIEAAALPSPHAMLRTVNADALLDMVIACRDPARSRVLSALSQATSSELQLFSDLLERISFGPLPSKSSRGEDAQ